VKEEAPTKLSMSSNNTALIAVVVSFVVNFAISAALFGGFGLLRPRNKAVYEPKLKYADDSKKPYPIADSFFEWIKPIFQVDEVAEVSKIGVDATMFLGFVRFGARFFAALTLVSLPMMILHYFAPAMDRIPTQQGLEVTLNLISIANVTRGSNIFFVHAIMAYVVTAYAYYLLYSLWFEYIELRKFYFSGEYLQSFRNKVLLFTDNEHSTLPEFQKHLSSLDLPYSPQQVLLGRDYSELSTLVQKHFELTCNLEKVLNKFLKDPNHKRSERPTHKEGAILGVFGGTKVDSIDFYKKELLEIEEKIYRERAKRDADFLPDSSVFVAYADLIQAHTNAKKLIHPFSRNAIYQFFNPHPTVKLCPDFDDIIWENIGLTPAVKRTRKLIATAIQVGLTIGWVFLGTLLGYMSNSVNFDFLPREFSGLGVFLQSIMVPVFTAILNILLPIFLRRIAILQGVVSVSGVERSALMKYFVFQVYQYFIQIGSSTIPPFVQAFFSGKADSREFETLFKALTSNAVASSYFFVTLIASGITFYGIEIIQAAPLILTFVKKRFFNATPREEYQMSEAPNFNYLVIYGFLLMAFLTGTSYSLTAPLIVPFCAATFGVAYVTMKYQLFYVYQTQHESGGIWWPKIFNVVCFSIGLFQATVFGTLVVFGTVSRSSVSRYPNLMVAPLPFLTFAFWLYCTFLLEPQSQFLSKDLNVNIPNYKREERFETDVLKNRVFNPAVIKLLPKVWVTKDVASDLSLYYQPKYKDVIDYVKQTNPSRLGETTDQEMQRQQQRNSLSRHKSIHLRPLSGILAAEEQPLSPEEPPELEEPVQRQVFIPQHVHHAPLGDYFSSPDSGSVSSGQTYHSPVRSSARPSVPESTRHPPQSHRYGPRD
jgi:hypothetical protein